MQSPAIQLLLSALFMSTAWAQAPRKTEPCLHYDPSVVRLKGIITRKQFPGPPEYSDIKKGDAIEIFWILKTDHPFCVDQDNPKEDIDIPESNINQVQLVVQNYNKYKSKKLIGKHVVVTGTLFHAITIHHRTKVLIMAQNIEPDTP